MVSRILRADEDRSESLGESCEWLNLILKWCYAELASLPTFSSKLNLFFEDMILNFRRSRSMGAYITSAKLIDVELGTKAPSFKHARVIPVEGLTTLCVDMNYNGGILGICKLDLVGGWQVYMRARLCEVSGPLYIIVKDTDMFYAMGRIDDLKIRCQLIINGVQFRWLDWIMSRLVLPQFLRYKLVLPAMKAKFLVSPEQLVQLQDSINKEKVE